nr:MAG TPA: GTP-binding nuclear protein Ran, Nuclear protein, GDP, Ran, Nuclear [Caudoviricetes sp.]
MGKDVFVYMTSVVSIACYDIESTWTCDSCMSFVFAGS